MKVVNLLFIVLTLCAVHATVIHDMAGLHVVGNKILNHNNDVVQLLVCFVISILCKCLFLTQFRVWIALELNLLVCKYCLISYFPNNHQISSCTIYFTII
jgi:hypothetical protein